MIPARPGAVHRTRVHQSSIGYLLDILPDQITIPFIVQCKVNERAEVRFEISHVIAALARRKGPGIDGLAIWINT